MELKQFEAMTRFLAASGTRRGLVRGGLAALGLGALRLPWADEAAAQRRPPRCTVCNDEDDCPFTSVQAAIAAAAPGSTITICNGTYEENITITKNNLVLLGQRAQETVLKGRGNASVVTVQKGVTATIEDVRITDGRGTGGRGGGILNFGDLTMNNCIIEDNKARNGGGIFNASNAKLILDNAFVQKNDIAATLQSLGGGIFNDFDGTVVVGGSRIAENEAAIAGGVFNRGDMTISSSDVNKNKAAFGGGGIHSSGVLTLTNGVDVANNEARANGGGILINKGSLTVSDSRIIANTARSGGGIYIQFPDGGSVTLRRGSVVRNDARDTGGGIFTSSGGQVTLDAESRVNNNDPNDCVGTDVCNE